MREVFQPQVDQPIDFLDCVDAHNCNQAYHEGSDNVCPCLHVNFPWVLIARFLIGPICVPIVGIVALLHPLDPIPFGTALQWIAHPTVH